MPKKPSAKYVDGYLLLVPKKKLPEYKKMAKDAAIIWKKYGALNYKECVIDDPNPMPEYLPLTFPKIMKPKPSEVVIFSYIEYKNKTHRDQVNKKVMKEMDEMMKDDPDHMKNMPFDMKKMAFGGFKVIVSD